MIFLLISAFPVCWWRHKTLQSWFDPKKCWYQQKSGELGKNNNKEEDYVGYPIIGPPLQEIVTDFVPIYAFFRLFYDFFVQKAKSAEKMLT